MTRNVLLVFGLAFATSSTLHADVTTFAWTFGTTIPVATPTGSRTGLSVGGFTIGNSLGTVSAPINVTSPSNVYAGASGQQNIGNAHRTGALVTGASGSGYYSFSVSNTSGGTFALSDFDFGARSTGTGAVSYSLRSDADSFATDILTGSIANNSTWAFKDNTFTAFNIADGATVEFRLYGYGGAGSPGSGTQNTRLDDVAATFVTVPEAGSFLFAGLACCASAGVAFVRSRRARRA